MPDFPVENDVEIGHVELLVFEQADGFLEAPGREVSIALVVEKRRQGEADAFLVVDDQDRWPLHAVAFALAAVDSGSLMFTVVYSPGRLSIGGSRRSCR